MSVISDAAQSPGDVMRRLADLERQVQQLLTARRLEAAAVGRGGMRVHSGGGITLEDGGSLLVDDGGDITARGGRIVAEEPDGTDVFRVGTDPAELFLRQDLLSPFAVEVLADRVDTDEVNEFAQINNETTFIDLPASPGPEVTAEVLTGVALVLISARIQCTAAGVTETVGHMGVEVSGASSVAADVADSMALVVGNISDITRVDGARMTSVRPFTGLTPGINVFTAKYRTGATADNVSFDSRSLTVIAL